MEEIEAEANAAALRQVAAMLQRPDQLEKLDLYKKKAIRKKAAVDAMLKTAVRMQLEGVRTGIHQLATVVQDVQHIEHSLDEMRDTLARAAPMKEKLSALRESSIKQRQYAAAIENLKHIYNVPATLTTTKQLIDDNCLLHAHKNLMDLERARDDLMLELHRLPTQSEHDVQLLQSYFNGVEQLAAQLGKQVMYIMSRCLAAVRGADPGPQQVVTALRIVEQEERIDVYCASESSSFVPIGRPRAWREKVFATLHDTTRHRIEGNQLEDRSLNKQWLARYLEVIRRITVDDLKVAQSACPPCFPPDYYIYDRFVRMYHETIADRLGEIAAEELEKNELVQLLAWVNDYAHESMLGKASLNIEIDALIDERPLIARADKTRLYERYMHLLTTDVTAWMQKTLTREKDEWYAGTTPERDSIGQSYTSMPGILFQMIEDQVTLAKEMTVLLVPDVVSEHVTVMLAVSQQYKLALDAFKLKYFEDRDKFRHSFTRTMVAACNNAETCTELADKVVKHVRLTMVDNQGGQRPSLVAGISREAMLADIDALKANWQSARNTALRALYDELCRDLAPHYAEFVTKKWLTASSGPSSVVCETVRDYCTDYASLRPPLAHTLIMHVHMRTIFEFLAAMQARRYVCASETERSSMARQLRQDGRTIRDVFASVTSGMTLDVPPPGADLVLFENLAVVLPNLAEIMEVADKSMLPLVVSSFVRKNADMTAEQLAGFMSLREDVSTSEATTLARDALHHNRIRPPHEDNYTRLFTAQFWPDTTEKASTASALLSKAKELKDTLKAPLEE